MARLLTASGEKVALVALFDTYNHNGCPPRFNFWGKIVYQKEKLLFHWANIKSVPWQEKVTYIRAKFEGAWDREVLKLSASISNFLRKSHYGHNTSTSVLNLETHNEQAGFAYKPQPYTGRVSLFKFQKNFSFLLDPALMGWSHEICDKLQVIELPVYPGGMFVEPYVETLAEKLKSCLE